MKVLPSAKIRGRSLTGGQFLGGSKSQHFSSTKHFSSSRGTLQLYASQRQQTEREEWKIAQAGALVATSLQQALQRSVSEAAPVLRDLWGSRSKLGENAASLAEASWSPLGGVKSRVEGRIAALQEQKSEAARNSTEAEKKKASEAVRLLLAQADGNMAFQLLKSRAENSSQPGARADGFKLGLVVEGGGMRGACSAGSLQALHDLGLRECFDAVYGSSAGACNATYFLSGQRHGADIYAQHISNTDFIDLRRLLKRNKDPRPALNLPYLLDHIMNDIIPLDWQAVIDSPVPLKIVASCLDSLSPILLERFEDENDLRECLRASASVPVVAGEPVSHRGRRLVDAAVFEAIPLRAAIADGCTHCIVLPTRPPYKKGDYVGRWIDDAVSNLVIKAVLSPDWMKEAWLRELQYQRSFGVTAEQLLVQSLEPEAHKLPGMEGVHVFPLFPGPASSYSPMCIDAPTVMLGVAEGRNAVLKILGSLGVCPIPDYNAQKFQHKPQPATEIKAVKVNAS